MSTEELQQIPVENEPSSFRLIITLGIAGFLSGCILVGIYIFTKPIIAKNKAEALKAAIFEVLPNTSGFKMLEADGTSLKELPDGTETTAEVIYMGLNESGEITGFAVPGEEPGYADIIAALAGYNPGKKTVIGFKVLESKETPGLGDKIFKNEEFQTNFIALEVEPDIEFVKNGERTSANQVEGITGATISSTAVTRLLSKTFKKWKDPIEEFMATTDLKLANHE